MVQALNTTYRLYPAIQSCLKTEDEREGKAVNALDKQVIWIDNAGHTSTIDAREQFDAALVNQVLPMVVTHSQDVLKSDLPPEPGINY